MALGATIRQRGPLSNAVALGALGLCLLAAAPAGANGELGTGTLLIAGTRLEISPESQTVPYNTPTIVDTHLAGYDPENGILPPDLRVLADFTGPEVNGDQFQLDGFGEKNGREEWASDGAARRPQRSMRQGDAEILQAA